MLPILLSLLVGAFAPYKAVTSLSVQPDADRTEVVVRLDGDVTWRHFSLSNPERVVLDISGAKQGLALTFSDIQRGGVTGMRIGQFNPTTVRVVIDLSQPVKYVTTEEGGEIRISFPNPQGNFEPWQTGLSPRGVQTAAPAPAPERAPAPVPAPVVQPSVERASPPVPAPAQARRQPRVSVSFQDEPIMNVLLTFSEFAGRSIVAPPDVKAIVVTADVRDQPWDVALEAILSAHGLAARETENGILIVEQLSKIKERIVNEPQVTQIFYIKYASADTLKTTIQPMLTQGNGTVSVNPAANALLITDTKSAIERIGPLIQQMDVRTPQVTISAKIIFIDRTALEELGFVYDLRDSRINGGATNEGPISVTGDAISAVANANYRVPTPALQMVGSLLIGRHSLVTFLDALQSLTLSDIQAAPSITVLDHREARIQVGERTPIRTLDAGSVGGDEGPRASVRTEQTGIILRVTPHITGNQVLLDLHAERSNLAAAPSDLGFTFQTQEAQTQVLVDNGETAVIGGLTIIEKTKVRAGIPILMNLPGVGALFRNTSERENKRDLLIMVTPHIVQGTP